MSSRLLSLAALITLFACGTALAKPHVIIRYERTGGFAGVENRMLVKSNNVALCYARGSANPLPAGIGAQKVARLRELLDAANLAGSKRHYPAPGAADTFQYSLTYKGHTVDGDQTALPKRIMRAVRALQKTYDDIFNSSE
jgi:hypothetical protein